jgi:hypothetical protein
MRVALRGSYIDFVIFMGLTEKYPLWFEEELYECTYTDESRYTFWVPYDERKPDYHDKQLIEDYSVFLRKPNGEVFVTDYDVFQGMYTTFTFSEFTHSGIAAFDADCIEYVECQAGVLPAGYPEWFYEFFTEAFNYPQDEKTYYFYDASKNTLKASRDALEVSAGGDVEVTEHCVFLRNKFGEIRGMLYDDFLKYYDPNPLTNIVGGYLHET